jgi:DNA modification methylase
MGKGHVLGHSDYHWSHEPILYCRKTEQNTEWLGDRTQKTFISNATVEDLEQLKKEELIAMIQKIKTDSDVLKVKKDPTQEYLHATQKPVELSKMMIRNSTPPQGAVIEPCGGSGSTLIACEVLKRKCYCIEINPANCDIILTRWANYTSQEPIRIKDKKKWSEIQKGK